MRVAKIGIYVGLAKVGKTTNIEARLAIMNTSNAFLGYTAKKLFKAWALYSSPSIFLKD